MRVRIDPARDALVIVDVQNDFCPGGALGVSRGDEVVPVLNAYADRFAAAGAPVFASRDWHPARTRHFATDGGPWPVHCVRDTWGARFAPGLTLPAGAEIVSKGMEADADAYSAWEARTAAGDAWPDLLAARGTRRLFVGGLATDYCVKATALDALRHGLEVVVLEDGSRPVDVSPGDGARALEELARAGARRITLADVAG